MDSRDIKAALVGGAAVLASVGLVNMLGGKTTSKEVVPKEFQITRDPSYLFHIGIEMGGTTCKVGIMKDSSSLELLDKTII